MSENLYDRVTELEAIVRKLRRMIDDVYEDVCLATEKSLRSTGGNARLTVTDDKIKSIVSSINKTEKSISSITQTAEEIIHEVAQYKIENGEEIEELKSTVTQTANELKTEVINYTDNKYSQISQTANGILATVENRFSDVAVLDSRTSPKPDKSKVYFYDGEYFYYSEIENAWKSTTDGFLKTAFKQTGDGFSIGGNVRIDGNTFVNGQICGSAIYDSDSLGCLTLGSNGLFADLTYRRASDDKEMFKIYDGIDNTSIWLRGSQLGHVGSSGSFFAGGVWDFSAAEIVGLSAAAVFG